MPDAKDPMTPSAGQAAASGTQPVDRSKAGGTGRPAHGWTFFSNHAHVLFCLSGEPNMLLKDVAARVGVTERAVLRIVAELEDAGVLRRQREGRRNRYVVISEARLRHAVESHCTVGELLAVILRR